MIVTYIHSNCADDQVGVQLRCRNLVDAINRTGIHGANLLDMNSFIHKLPEAQKICAGSDLLVIYRYLYGPILNAVQYWKARDKKVIVDFDLAINYLTKDKPGHSFWLDGVPLEDGLTEENSIIDPAPLEQFKWGLGMVDAATVSSGRLADDWSQFTDIHQIPEYINTFHYPGLNQFHEDEIWVGLGSSANYDGFKKSGLLAAMESVCQKHPQVTLVMCNVEEEVEMDLKIAPAQLKVFSPNSFDEWVSILLQLDIGLAPSYGDFDLRLGPASLLEFMISKIPVIASKQIAFHELLQYARFVHNKPNEWAGAIVDTLAQLYVYQKRAASDPFLYAITQDAGANIEKVLKVYNSIINQA